MVLLRIGECAVRLQLSTQTVRSFLRQGKLRGIRVTEHETRIPEAEITRLIEERGQTPQIPTVLCGDRPR